MQGDIFCKCPTKIECLFSSTRYLVSFWYCIGYQVYPFFFSHLYMHVSGMYIRMYVHAYVYMCNTGVHTYVVCTT